MELTIEDVEAISSVIRKLNATSPYEIYQALKEDGPISFYLPSLFPGVKLSSNMKPEPVELKVSMIFLGQKGKIKIGLNK